MTQCPWAKWKCHGHLVTHRQLQEHPMEDKKKLQGISSVNLFRLNSILFEFQNLQNFGSNVDWNKLLFGNMIAFGYFESFRKSQTHWRCLIEEKNKLYSYEITVTITAIVYNIWKLSSSYVSGNTDVLASILWRPIDNPLEMKISRWLG